MKSILSIFLFLLFYMSSNAQDLIVKRDSSKIYCEIYAIDSTKFYFKHRQKNKMVDTYLYKSAVAYHVLNYLGNPSYSAPDDHISTKKKDELNKAMYSSAITFGLLQGGGSLLGVDFETTIARYFGIQFGAGIIGYGAGLNFHFKPTTRSSFVSLQYWHQGIGSGYTQSVASANYVFRGKRWFTFQAGLGVPVGYGPAYIKNAEKPPVILTYAIGGYIPIGRYQ